MSTYLEGRSEECSSSNYDGERKVMDDVIYAGILIYNSNEKTYIDFHEGEKRSNVGVLTFDLVKRNS